MYNELLYLITVISGLTALCLGYLFFKAWQRKQLTKTERERLKNKNLKKIGIALLALFTLKALAMLLKQEGLETALHVIIMAVVGLIVSFLAYKVVKFLWLRYHKGIQKILAFIQGVVFKFAMFVKSIDTWMRH